MEEQVVLKPITTPYSDYCNNIQENWGCRYLMAGICTQGFVQRFDQESGNYLKDKDCLNLIFEENIR